MIGQRWGVTHAETRIEYVCDRLVPAPALELWRGVDVAAPIDEVWPWLRMLRLAPYSYDLIDNFGRRSPRTLVSLPDPAVGDPLFREGIAVVVDVEPGRSLTGQLGRAGGPAGRTLMTYALQPDGHSTRLLLKIAVERGGLLTRAVTAVLPVGDLVMARKQLLTLAALAAR